MTDRVSSGQDRPSLPIISRCRATRGQWTHPLTAGDAPALSRDGEIRPGYWDPTASGRHLISRPISIDGLLADRARIELTPRIVQRGAAFLDDSYNAVDVVARQLASVFTLEQLVLATVALRVHMRIGRERMQNKKALQEKWTALAHRLMKLRGEERHVSLREQRIAEERASLAATESSRPGRRGAPGDRGGRGRTGAAGLEGREPRRPGNGGPAWKKRRPLSWQAPRSSSRPRT